ncbi:histone H1t [Saccopteryx leptura]|uniref:histone H1t n=1 Tax=Saccopteryx leptura TaxID=249018 RepID=UPI00339C24AB
MSEKVPVDWAQSGPSMEKPLIKKRGKKMVAATGMSHKTSSSSVSKLITEALSVSQERGGMSLVALKKTLAATGYDVDKNNSRIKLVLKSLVSKGTVVQTTGTGASGSFKLSKKASPELTKVKVKKPATAKTKKLALSKEPKSPKNTKNNKRGPKPKATVTPEAARGNRKAAGAKGKPQRKSPAKARADKPTGRRTKLIQQKTNPGKAAPKK